jgi:hypothetical protein
VSGVASELVVAQDGHTLIGEGVTVVVEEAVHLRALVLA